jgi:hypothetical protein
LHQSRPPVERLGVASFRTGTEALHGVAWLGTATVFPQALGLGAMWDEDLLHAVATAVSVEMRAFHRHRPTENGTGTNSLQAIAIVDATRTDGDAVTPADPERVATLVFRDVDLSGAARVEVETARDGGGTGETLLQFLVGDQLLAQIDVPVTGDRYAWTTATAALAAPSTASTTYGSCSTATSASPPAPSAGPAETQAPTAAPLPATLSPLHLEEASCRSLTSASTNSPSTSRR